MIDKDKNSEFENPTDYTLPKVSAEISESLAADVKEQGVDAVIRQADERLQVSNPILYERVGRFALGVLGPNPSSEAIKALHGTMIMTHELLRRQAEADALSTMLDRSEV